MQAISNVIFKFANSFDTKEWHELKTVLAAKIVCDYTDLRGIIETLTPDEYVQKRIEALNHLHTQHFMSNLEVYVNGNGATCRALSVILRNKNGILFNTHAIYNFKLSHIKGKWLIHYIKQNILWQNGNPFLHSATKETQTGNADN